MKIRKIRNLVHFSPSSCDNNAKYTADDIKSLEDKICALSNSLQSLNEAKSKNEAIYQNDKKSMLVNDLKIIVI